MSITGGIIGLNISKDMEDLNSTINQPDLIDVHKSHLTTADHTFFSRCNGIFTKIHHILLHKTNLGLFPGIEILQNVYSDSVISYSLWSQVL